MNDSQVIHDTKDVAAHFKIHTSTVRKYCDFLEKAGYSFHKNEYGHRGFFDEDLMVLRKLIELKRTMALEEASKSAIAWKNGSDVSDGATPKEQYIVRYSDLLEEFKDFKKEQESFNRELLTQLKSQQDYMNSRLEERDQNLMNALNQSLETQKQLASTSTQQKKWWKFWK
ncbi:DUF3967 domain-containing protein [Oceanobacillus sp. CF4.6]|uniref:DUF3967 domain-containing protein n=1 Tax=Oceanobacillus sp. CF4.6 TaxID=3373080 RepID=UPI003EE581DC